MNQAIIQPNEFTVKVELSEAGVKFTLRNPHIEIGQDQEYNLGAWEILKACMNMFKGETFTNMTNKPL